MIHKFVQAALVRLARFIHRWPGLILGAALLLTAVSTWLTVTRLQVIDDTDSLISSNSPSHRYYLDYVKEFGDDSDYAVVIRSPDVAKNRQVADWVGQQFDQLAAANPPQLRRVFYKLDFSRIADHSLLFLDPDDLLQTEKEVAAYSQVVKTKNAPLDINTMFDQADAMFNDKYLRKSSNWKDFKPFVDRFADMLNQLADQIEDKKKAPAGPTPSTPAGSAIQGQMVDAQKEMEDHEYPGSFDDGQTIIVTATPGVTTGEARPDLPTITKIRALLAQARVQFPGVEIGLTGQPVLMDDEIDSSSRDTIHAALLAVVLVALLFFVSYKTRTRPIVALLVLLMAVICSLGFTVLSVGHLNLISESFVAMVIGLGIDFGIQIMGRYEEELSRGASIADALVASLGHTGAAVVTGATTTAVAFYTMCFSDFIGLSEFGVIAGTGILLCLAASLVLLPACYVLMDRRKSPQVLRQKALASSLPAEQINRALFAAPKAVVAIAALLTVAAACFVGKVGFDYNLLNLQDPTLDSVRTARSLNTPGHSLLVAVSVADNLDQARQRVAQFQALPSVADVYAPIVDLTPVDADKKVAIIKRIVASMHGVNVDTDVSKQVDVPRAQAEISQFLADCNQAVAEAKKYILVPQAREAVTVFGKLIPPLQRAQDAMKGLSQQELGRRFNSYQVNVLGVMQRNYAVLAHQKADANLTLDDIPPQLRERYLSPNGKILIEIAPKDNVWERGPDAEFVKELRTVDPRVTGDPVQNYEYIDLLRSSYVNAAKWAAVAIVVLITLHFLRGGLILLTILPLVLAIVWTLGLMGAIGWRFNPANVITLPLVIGIGVAYGVYTVDRFREDPRLRLFSSSTGKAIVLSALTAMIGFGSMMISSHRGMRSLGLLMFTGVGMCLVTSIVVLPQILTGFKGNSEEPPAPEPETKRDLAREEP